MKLRVISGLLALVLGVGPAFGSPSLAMAPPAAPASCSADGSASAPSGVAEYPNLFKAYRARPHCEVAGVDYAVGVPSATVLRDPSSAAWGGPLKYGPNEHTLRCTGPYAGVIDGFDFTLHGGMAVYDVSCRSLVIRNSKFREGRNCLMPINASANAPNVMVINDEIDGGGTASGCPPAKTGEAVQLGGGGDLVVRYSWIKNVAQHFISFLPGSRGGGSIDARFNLEERCGFYQGNHCDGGQIVGGTWKPIVIEYNTFISDQPDTPLSSDGVTAPTAMFKVGSEQVMGVTGLVMEGASANSLHVGETIVSPCLPPNTVLKSPLGQGVKPLLTTSKGAIKSDVCPFDVIDAYPSGMVDPIRYVAQLGSTLLDGHIIGNTIITTGPIVGVSYPIYCGAAPSGAGAVNQVSDVEISDNFIDDSGTLKAGLIPGGPTACRGPQFKAFHNVNGAGRAFR